jgi:hypothetical protein
VEETLRLYPPFYGFFRRTACPVEINGVEVPEGRDIYMGWAAANRDPDQFERADMFDIDRASSRHMAFGFGIHSCPGAALARMELKVLLEELLDALPDLTIGGPVPPFAFGGDDYTRFAELILSPVRRHHVFTNFAIDVNGDKAFAIVYMTARHWKASDMGASEVQPIWLVRRAFRPAGRWLEDSPHQA